MSMVRCDECEIMIDSDDDPDCFGEDGNAPDILCDNCRQNAAERAWERLCEDFHDGGSTRFVTLQQQQADARRLK